MRLRGRQAIPGEAHTRLPHARQRAFTMSVKIYPVFLMPPPQSV